MAQARAHPGAGRRCGGIRCRFFRQGGRRAGQRHAQPATAAAARYFLMKKEIEKIFAKIKKTV